MKKWIKTLFVLTLAAAIVVLLRFTVFKAQPVPVTTHQVGAGRVEDTVVNSRAGTVKSRQRAEMSPGIPGLVTELPVQKGARVQQGDIVLRLDDSEHRAQVDLAEAALVAARAAAGQARLETEQAHRDLQRVEALAREAVVSEDLTEQYRTRAASAEAALRVAEAKIKQAQASLDAAQATLAKTVMRAPFDGVVLDVTTEVGEWISPSPPGVFIPPVVDLIRPDTLYVSAPIDEADVARIRVGLPLRITLDAFRGRSFDGTLTYVSSFVETRQDQNRTLEVEAEFGERALPANLLPGLSADLEIILAAREDVLRIPTYALLEESQVMVIEQDRLTTKSVQTGLRNWSYTEITAGLQPGEQVVVSLDRPEVVAGAKAIIRGESSP